VGGARSTPDERRCGWRGVAEDRSTDPSRIDVVEIEMQLRDHADIRPALPVDWNEGFDSYLKGISHPDETRIDGAGRHRAQGERVRSRCWHRCPDAPA